MKNKFSIFNFKLFHYLKQLITNEYPDSKPDLEKRKVAVENNLRWQDDGGPVVDNTKPLGQLVENKPPQPIDLVKKDSL